MGNPPATTLCFFHISLPYIAVSLKLMGVGYFIILLAIVWYYGSLYMGRLDFHESHTRYMGWLAMRFGRKVS